MQITLAATPYVVWVISLVSQQILQREGVEQRFESFVDLSPRKARRAYRRQVALRIGRNAADKIERLLEGFKDLPYRDRRRIIDKGVPPAPSLLRRDKP